MAASNSNPFPDVGTFTELFVIFFKAICYNSQNLRGSRLPLNLCSVSVFWLDSEMADN